MVMVTIGSCALLLDAGAPLDYYRTVDEQTIVVGAGTGPAIWVRVTTQSETADTITVGVRAIRAPVPSTASQVTEITVRLASPLGARRVIDALSGLEVPLR
jgi:hypothetical protein